MKNKLTEKMIDDTIGDINYIGLNRCVGTWDMLKGTEMMSVIDELIVKASRVDELTKTSKKLSDIRKHSEYEEIGKAIIYLAETDSKHDMLRYLEYVMGVFILPDGDGAYDVKLLDWYRDEVKDETI